MSRARELVVSIEITCSKAFLKYFRQARTQTKTRQGVETEAQDNSEMSFLSWSLVQPRIYIHIYIYI